MPPVLATTVIKDGGGTNITGGVQTLELSGNGTSGPFDFINALVDGATGTTLATVKKANTTAVAGDTALVIGLNPLSNAVSQTGTWTAVVSGTTFISGGTVTSVVSGTTFLSGGTITAVVGGTTAVSTINGIAPAFGTGSTNASTQRVTIANDQLGTLGQAAMASSVPVAIASDQSRIPVSPPLTISTTVTPTLATTNAYTATQVVGGILTFTSVLGTATSGIIQSITCKFNTGVMTTGLSVSIFKATPAAGTYTDHVVAAINTTDVASLIGTYRLATAYSDLGNFAVYNLDGIAKAFQSATSNVYGVVTSLGTTLALGNVTTFSVELGVLPG